MICQENCIVEKVKPIRRDYAAGQVSAGIIMLMLALLLLVACGQGNGESHDTGDSEAEGHASEATELLLFSGRTEWFIEYSPLIEGKTSAWLIHLTKLSDGKPVQTKSVRVRVEFSGGEAVDVDAVRKQSGIYAADVPGRASGEARLSLSYSTQQYSDTIRIAAVSVYASEHDAHEHEQHPVEDGIAFTREQAWEMDFRTDPVHMLPFSEIIKTTGHLLSHPDLEVEVPATVSGVLTFRGKPMLPGQPVSKGEVLAVITGAGLSGDNMEARISDAAAQFEKALADYERAKTLLEGNVISKKSFEESKLRFEQADNSLRVLKAGVGPAGKILRAPSSGYVKAVYVPNGAYVREGEHFISIARNDRMLLKAEVYQNDYALLSTIHGAVFRAADNMSRDIRELNGRLSARGQAVDASAYSVPVYFELNGADLIPGEFVDVYLKAGAEKKRLVIPASALTEDLGRYYVYVRRGGERFEKREVAIGTGDGVYVPVSSGLKEGEHIVTKGMYALRLAASAGQVRADAHQH